MNKNYDYKRLTPFIWFVLQNFPFIDEDFDAITNYQLFCKLGEEINKLIISMNQAGEQVEELTEYVSTFFDNLDVQEEVDNKIDRMVEDGTLQEIITQYLNVSGILAFNTVSAMKNATNLEDGSFVKTYGKLIYNDGLGEFYKIRTILNTDTIDEVNIISLNNFPTLIAELMPDAKITNLQNQINHLFDESYIIMGDSYGADSGSWIDKIIAKIPNIDCYKFAQGGIGFAHASSVSGNTFLTYLQSRENEITDKTKITKIIVCGGYNDSVDVSFSDIRTAITNFCYYCKTNYPNAKIYIGMIGFNKEMNSTGGAVRDKLATIVLPAYANNYDIDNAPVYISKSELILHNTNLIGDDNVHPNNNGQIELCRYIYNFIKNNSTQILIPKIEDNLITVHWVNEVDGSCAFLRNNEISNIRFVPIPNTTSTTTVELTGLSNIEIKCGTVNNTNKNIIGTIETPYLFPSIHKQIMIPCVFILRSNNIIYSNLKGFINIDEEKHVVLYCAERDSSNNYYDFTNVDYIRFDTPIETFFPTLYN